MSKITISLLNGLYIYNSTAVFQASFDITYFFGGQWLIKIRVDSINIIFSSVQVTAPLLIGVPIAECVGNRNRGKTNAHPNLRLKPIEIKI